MCNLVHVFIFNISTEQGSKYQCNKSNKGYRISINCHGTNSVRHTHTQTLVNGWSLEQNFNSLNKAKNKFLIQLFTWYKVLLLFAAHKFLNNKFNVQKSRFVVFDYSWNWCLLSCQLFTLILVEKKNSLIELHFRCLTVSLIFENC